MMLNFFCSDIILPALFVPGMKDKGGCREKRIASVCLFSSTYPLSNWLCAFIKLFPSYLSVPILFVPAGTGLTQVYKIESQNACFPN